MIPLCFWCKRGCSCVTQRASVFEVRRPFVGAFGPWLLCMSKTFSYETLIPTCKNIFKWLIMFTVNYGWVVFLSRKKVPSIYAAVRDAKSLFLSNRPSATLSYQICLSVLISFSLLLPHHNPSMLRIGTTASYKPGNLPLRNALVFPLLLNVSLPRNPPDSQL